MMRLAIVKRNKEFERDCIKKMSEANNLAEKRTFLSRFFRAKLTAQKVTEMKEGSTSRPDNI